MERFKSGAYVALAGISLESAPVKFPRGIELRETSFRASTPMILDYQRPFSLEHLPKLLPIGGEPGHDITCEIAIPGHVAEALNDQMEVASTIVFLLRVYADPAVSMLAISHLSFSEIYDSDQKYIVIPIQRYHRHLEIRVAEPEKVRGAVAGAATMFEVAHRLRLDSGEFRTLTYAFEKAQFLEDSALSLISLWGALEAMFSPSTTELRFRVSVLIASYLREPGQERLDLQKRVAALYDKRSAAAHGKPKHAGGDLFDTIVLVREVLLKCLRQGSVPSREQLEQRLFGVG